MKIKLLELVGSQCLSLDEGERLYQRLYPALKNGETAEVDFAGVETVLTPFLHAGLGKLLDLFGTEAVLGGVSPLNIAPELLLRFNQYIERRGREIDQSDARGFLEDAFGEDELTDSGL